MALETSILKTVKKNLDIPIDYDEFDMNIITHINAALATLSELDIGPAEGFFIEDDEAVWDDFFTENTMNDIKTYVTLRVRLLFDPPTSSYALASFKEQIKEFEWRLNMKREVVTWTDPNLTV